MNVFKSIMLKWWQIGIFKAGMLAVGVAVGAVWHDFFSTMLYLLMAMAVASLAYISFVWLKQ